MTFAQAKASNIANVSGVAAESDQFKAYLNEAVQRLMTRGDFMGLVVPVCVCIKRGCVVFPRYVSVIREAKTCSGHLNIKNLWYEFVERSWYDGLFGDVWNEATCQNNMLAKGRVPTHNTVMGAARKIRAYPQVAQDFGKMLTIFGTDNSGQPLMHRDSNGDWREGIVLTLQTPYAESEGYVSSIDRVVKDVTQKPVTLWAYNTTDSVLEDLAVYDPGETNPSFARYQINTPSYKDADGNEKFRSVTALVKLNYVPVEFDTDLVLIDNMAALKLMIQGIKAEEAGDDQLAESKIIKAVRELNHQIQDQNPGDQVAVYANSVGSTIYSPI